MEGWKYSVVIAFFLAACAVDASPYDAPLRNCSEIRCSENPDGLMFPCPVDKCASCCCFSGGEFAVYHKCPSEGLFDPGSRKCHGENMCHECNKDDCDKDCWHDFDYPVKNSKCPCKYCICHPNNRPPTPANCPCGMSFDPKLDTEVIPCRPDPKCPCTCGNITCPDNMVDGDEVRFPNANDRCGFCCCLPGWDVAKARECPFHEMYDRDTNDCVPDPTHSCPSPNIPTDGPPTRAPPTGGPGPYRGCHGVPCPSDPTGVPLYACDDPQYFCQCDWGGHVHQMPCAGGTVFNFKLQTCL